MTVLTEQELAAVLSSPLFAGFSAQEAERMLHCLSTERQELERGTVLLDAGTTTHRVAMVLSGGVRLVYQDTLEDRVGPGGLIAAAQADVGSTLPYCAVAAVPTTVLFLDAQRIYATCMSSCPYHIRLVRNFRAVISGK